MRLALAALLLASTPLAHAQTAVGLRAGRTGARLTQTDASLLINGSRPGLTAGVFAEVPLGRGVSVRPEVTFVQKGNRMASSSADYDFQTGVYRTEDVLAETRADYVEVPIFARVTRSAGGRVRVGAMAGPPVAVRTHAGAAHLRCVNGERSPYESGSVVVVTDPARVNLGLAVGGDVSYGPVGLEVRYTAGLTGAEPVQPSARFGIVAVGLAVRHTLRPASPSVGSRSSTPPRRAPCRRRRPRESRRAPSPRRARRGRRRRARPSPR